jgi:hypothetical protein
MAGNGYREVPAGLTGKQGNEAPWRRFFAERDSDVTATIAWPGASPAALAFPYCRGADAALTG